MLTRPPRCAPAKVKVELGRIGIRLIEDVDGDADDHLQVLDLTVPQDGWRQGQTVLDRLEPICDGVPKSIGVVLLLVGLGLGLVMQVLTDHKGELPTILNHENSISNLPVGIEPAGFMIVPIWAKMSTR